MKFHNTWPVISQGEGIFCPPSLSVNQMIAGVLEAFSGPGSRALPAEIMRQLPFPGPGGPTGLGSPRRFEILAGATGGPPMGPPHLAEARLILQEKGSPGRCFLRATPLTPSHDNGYRKVKGGKHSFFGPENGAGSSWFEIRRERRRRENREGGNSQKILRHRSLTPARSSRPVSTPQSERASARRFLFASSVAKMVG